MINTELIARAICQLGHCKECTEDCIDYRAAQRVVTTLELAGIKVEEAEDTDHGN